MTDDQAYQHQTPQAIRLVSMAALGSFSWRWPEATEFFDRGWAAVATVGDQAFRVRHGIGRRFVYGQSRIHSVTWVEGKPVVEGVEADDFEDSEALLSLIKVTKKHLKAGNALPPPYRSFQTALMSVEVSGRYSPASLALKLRQDDVEGWVRHALSRAHYWGRLRPRSRDRNVLPSLSASGPAPAEATLIEDSGKLRKAVTEAILAFGLSHQSLPERPAVDFTPDERANDLLRSNGFAFLVGVLFDQNMPAERAWMAPFLLLQRLGHLDPVRLVADESAVRAAIQTQPKLHRYVDKMPRWLVLAAQRVVDQYGGEASNIWANRPRADELQLRFNDFLGIGQKKAAMAVEILERDLGIPVRSLEGSDVAYDIHVRRVFLRTRLASRDDRDHIIAAARELHPARPGALDLPSWLIGRGWCHPGVPECAGCPLTAVCPKDIERASHTTST